MINIQVPTDYQHLQIDDANCFVAKNDEGETFKVELPYYTQY